MDKPLGKASRRTFGRIGTLVPFPCWNSLGVMSSDTLKFSKQPPSEALKGGLPVPAHRSACLRRSGFAQAGVSARRRVRFATVRSSLTRSLYGLEAIKRVLILSSLGAVPRRTVLEEIGKFSPRS